MQIGVMVESFKLGFRGGVEKTASLGVNGLQKYATGKELSWTDAEIREALDIVKSNGLVFSAICGDFGCGFHDPARNPEMIEKSKRVMEIAQKLECDIVTTHVHQMTEEESESNENIRAALEELGAFDGFLTIERECGATLEADITMVVDLLWEKLTKHGLG